jgi:hypothetical protein
MSSILMIHLRSMNLVHELLFSFNQIKLNKFIREQELTNVIRSLLTIIFYSENIRHLIFIKNRGVIGRVSRFIVCNERERERNKIKTSCSERFACLTIVYTTKKSERYTGKYPRISFF